MVRLVGLVVLGACGFQINAGSKPQDAGGDGGGDGAVTDGSVGDMLVDEAPPIDGDHTDWWDPQWTKRRRITLDTSTLTGAVADFPVLVRLPALTGTIASGADLRFVSLDGGTSYPYELEGFNALAQSPVWIRMTLSNAADTELWVYYANPAANPESSGSNVFSGNHLSVHHLGSLVDSSGNGHTASSPGAGESPATLLAGRIGAARTFDGNNDYLTLNDSNGPYDFSNQMYASAWIRVAGFEDAYQAIVTKGDSSWRMARSDANNGVSFGWTNANSNGNLLGNTPVFGGNAWHHVAIVQTQTDKQVYVDGQLDESVQNNEQLDNNNFSVRIGMNEEAVNPPNRFWHGDIDEVRISSSSRTAEWIFAEHRTADSTFATVGVEEIY